MEFYNIKYILGLDIKKHLLFRQMRIRSLIIAATMYHHINTAGFRGYISLQA
jgi:hypothetical protein